MLNPRNFKYTYLELLEEDTHARAVYSILENLPKSLEFFLLELSRESDIETKKRTAEIYNELTHKNFASVIQSLLKKDYLSMSLIFSHITAHVFAKETFGVFELLENYTNQLVKRLDKKVMVSGDPLQILSELNYKITQSFIIDDSFLGYFDFSAARRQHIISSYTLSILYLLIAEKLQLPLFGISFSDKLVLCYTEDYCQHNELVTENDILYYIIVGERDLIYTLEDVKLLAIIQEETIELKNILPQSNQLIIEGWLEHLQLGNFDAKTKCNLSSIYQQIFSTAEEF